MKHRNPIVVILLTFITFGIYGIVWSVLTAREMRAKGAEIPNAILIIIPIVNLYWQYKYSEGVEKVTNGKYSAPIVFVLFFFTGIGGQIISQIGFNEAVGGAATPANPVVGDTSLANPVAPVTPQVLPSATVGATQAAPTIQPTTQPDVASTDPTPVTPPTVTPSEPEVAAAPENPVQLPDNPELNPNSTFEPTQLADTLPSAPQVTTPEPSFDEVVPAPQPEETPGWSDPQDPNHQA